MRPTKKDIKRDVTFQGHPDFRPIKGVLVSLRKGIAEIAYRVAIRLDGQYEYCRDAAGEWTAWVPARKVTV